MREREIATEHKWGRGRERGTQNPKQAPGSELSPQGDAHAGVGAGLGLAHLKMAPVYLSLAGVQNPARLMEGHGQQQDY